MKMYKDILWIDDIDNNDGYVADLEDEDEEDISLYSDEMLSDEDKESLIKQDDSLSPYAQRIKLCRKMLSACHEINDYYRKYNLVIFDMNMTKGWLNRSDDIGKISEILLKNKMNGYKHEKEEDEIAGIYLYLLLLNKGYPADRMVIYTGNSTDSLKSNFPYLKLDNIVRYKGNDEDTLCLETNYYPENSYYRIRRLVLQACDYWKAEIASKKDEEIPFNQIYFSKDTDKQNSMENFQELLERIEMMFPVIPPSSPEKVYYQAARILCEYHEESAKIQVVNYNIYPLHAVCRNFRNWSSHNRLKKAEMPPNIFALIFCIALRTYFDEKQLINEFSKERFYYEKNYGYNYEDKEHKFSFDYIKNKLKDETSLLSVLDKKKKKNTISYSELVYIWGEDPSHDAEINYVLYPIIMRDYIKFTGNTVDSIKLNYCNSNYLFEDKKGKSYDNEFMKLVFNEACKICGYFR